MKESKIYITSDTFFGRESIALERGFKTSKEMNDAMTAMWNDRVKPNDTVYHLGNFAWDPITSTDMLGSLNGNKHFILGDKDHALLETVGHYNNTTILSSQILDLIEGARHFVLCHFPLEQWASQNKGSIHLHGNGPAIKSDLDKKARFNVTSDLWSFRPVELEEFGNLVEDYKMAKTN